MPLIVCANAKGGSGKTTWACALAGLIHQDQTKDVMLLDLDAQQGDAHDWAKRVGIRSELVWAEPYETMKAQLERAADSPGWAVVDCPPHEGPAMRVALALADLAVIPVQVGYADARGWGRMQALLRDTRELNPNLRVGVILNAVRSRVGLTDDAERLLDACHKPAEGTWFLGHVAQRQAVVEAWGGGQPIHTVSGPAGDEFRRILAKIQRLLSHDAMTPRLHDAVTL